MQSPVELEEQLAENWLLAGRHRDLEGTVSHLDSRDQEDLHFCRS